VRNNSEYQQLVNNGNSYLSEPPPTFKESRYSISGGLQQISGYQSAMKGAVVQPKESGFRMPKASDLARIGENLDQNDLSNVKGPYFQHQRKPPLVVTKRNSRGDVVNKSKGQE
jgi:hypothetical protein